MSVAGIGTSPDGSVERSIQSDRIPLDPIALLSSWLPSDDDPARPVATLATVHADGGPNARTVLLSSFTEGRAAFHVDSTSTKARELDERPLAALVLFWPELARQVVLRGVVLRVTTEEDRLAYARRSRYLQLLAWLNTPSFAGASRSERESSWSAFDAQHPLLSPPPTWAGYELVPNSIVFWEGSATAASRRAYYTRGAKRWTVEVLPG
ncbi:pyridoxamine 5'-phosphate oxidase family protein [uncultured Microbacterium sp.]|uniref:pyridoxamine 5'-phosphate oxidase family protein n=1 Tax=uncultured Microbacterium sp. TaxID=191216 RepID=UPI0035CA7BF9